MNKNMIVIAQAKEIRKKVNEGYSIKELEKSLNVTQTKIKEILEAHYTGGFKNKILTDLVLNDVKKNLDVQQEEVIVLDT